MWLFVGGDLVLFTLLFALFLHMRAEQVEVFGQGRAQLNQVWGLLNTLIMLSSSWCVSSALRAARRGRGDLLRMGLSGAVFCGLAFWSVKGFEYSEKLAEGISLGSNDFFMLYFIYTGIHLIHVTIGMAVLTALVLYARGDSFGPGVMRNLESGATFWHLVDLLWIVLFALLYLLGA